MQYELFEPDTLEVGNGTLRIRQARLGNEFVIHVDSIRQLNGEHSANATYVVCGGAVKNFFVGLPLSAVRRAIAEAERRQTQARTKQPDLPFMQGPDTYKIKTDKGNGK